MNGRRGFHNQRHTRTRQRSSACEATRSSAIEYAESLLVTVLLALFGTTFIVQAFKIPSQSMEPTLLVGDHLLVNKFLFEGRDAWYEKLLPYRPVERGDIVVFKFPFDDHPHYVKRVVGLPGDRIRIIEQKVYINGQPLDEPYVVHDPSGEDSFGDNFPPTDNYFIESGLRPEWAARILRLRRSGQPRSSSQSLFRDGRQPRSQLG